MNKTTINIDVPHDSAARIAREDAARECQCPKCGRLHHKLGNPPLSVVLPEWDELRRAVAEVMNHNPETWPDHGNAPLAIAANAAMLRNRADALEEFVRFIYEHEGECLGDHPSWVGRAEDLLGLRVPQPEPEF